MNTTILQTRKVTAPRSMEENVYTCIHTDKHNFTLKHPHSLAYMLRYTHASTYADSNAVTSFIVKKQEILEVPENSLFLFLFLFLSVHHELNSAQSPSSLFLLYFL